MNVKKFAVSAALGLVAVLGWSAPAEAAATQFTSPYATSFFTCSGSNIYLTGLVHYKETAPESNFEYSYRLTGVDSVTGERYRFNATVIGMVAGAPDGVVVEETFVFNVRLVGLGGAESLTARTLLHVTQVDGEVTADVLRIEASC